MKISAAGLYRISIELYHSDCAAGPSVSSSGLREIINRSPAHFWAYSYLNPERIEKPETRTFALGRAAHHLLLGEDQFTTLFIARPANLEGEPWQGNRKVCKQWLLDQAKAGRTVLLPAEIETIRGMAKSLAVHPLVKAGILNGEVEQSMIWPDPETGVYCKSRPDAVPNDSGDVCDLKTTTDVGYDDLSRTIGEFSYHQQAALVGEGFKQVLGRPMTSFSLCFVEKLPPYCVRVVTLKDCDLERGARLNRAALRIFADCMERGVWPGPGDYSDADFIEIPTWLQTRIDKQLQYIDGAKPDVNKRSARDYAAVG